MLTQPKPLLFGYLRLRITARRGAEILQRRALQAFADREGFALVEVYVDADENRPCAGMAALIRAVRSSDVDPQAVTVVVPDAGHLGLNSLAQQQMRARIQRETSARVVVLRRAR